MKNLNIRKRFISLLLAGSLSLIPFTSLATSYETGIDLVDDEVTYEYNPDITYEDWFKVQKGAYFADLLYEDCLNYLPPFMLNQFRTTNWNILLVGSKTWLKNNWGISGQGGCYYDRRTIGVEAYYRGESILTMFNKYGADPEYLENTDLVTMNYLQIRSAIFHECGHMLDYYYKYTDNNTWNRIYKEEKEFVPNLSSRYWEGMTNGTYNLKKNYEFWATCFEAYILCREDLQTYCPQAYEYINNIVYEKEMEFEENHPEYDYFNLRGEQNEESKTK